MAYWQGKAGDPDGAAAALAELLPVRERVLGPEHPYTLITRHELAYWQGKAGDPNGAAAKKRDQPHPHPRTQDLHTCSTRRRSL
ncbi:tetratricopeptide repeat protein [Streptomyces phaeofaciens]